MQVQRPTPDQRRRTKMTDGKAFVVYHGKGQIQALSMHSIAQWDAKRAPATASAKLVEAVQSAEQAVSNGAVV